MSKIIDHTNGPLAALHRACAKGESIAEVPAPIPAHVEQSDKTKALQAQFICPIWAVWFGKSVNVYFTSYHLEQFTRALRLNGTAFSAFNGRGEAV